MGVTWDEWNWEFIGFHGRINFISISINKKGNFLENKLANLAIEIEQNKIGEIIGVQDQCASAFGGLVHIYADKQGIRPRKFLVKEYQEYIESSLLMGFGNKDYLQESRLKSIKNFNSKQTLTS